MVEGGPGEHDGVLVGPLGGVPPALLQGVPEVAPGGVPHDPVGEAPPHQEGEVDLRTDGHGPGLRDDLTPKRVAMTVLSSPPLLLSLLSFPSPLDSLPSPLSLSPPLSPSPLVPLLPLSQTRVTVSILENN